MMRCFTRIREYGNAGMRAVLVLLLLLSALHAISAAAQSDASKPVPREIIAIYDGQGQYKHNLRLNMIHRVYEMPLNYLGYNVRYHDIHEAELPKWTDRTHGVIIYFDEELEFDRERYARWLARGVDQGKKMLLIGDIGVPEWSGVSDGAQAALKKIHEAAGVRHMGSWHLLTQSTVIDSIDPEVMNFERKITVPYPPYVRMLATSKGTSYLRMTVNERFPEMKADLIVSGPGGGYISPEYDYHEQDIDERFVTSWFIDPFKFLRVALGDMQKPRADITTHLGRRIFYSHIDGDGWNNLARIEGYDSGVVAASDIITEEILSKYSNFGFSVGLVVGDLVDSCFGSDKSREGARKTLALPNVEPASHTYTHPLYWQFFEDYDKEVEQRYASAFPKKAGLFAQSMKTVLGAHNHPKHSDRIRRLRTRKQHENDAIEFQNLTPEEEMLQVYDTPRSYDCVDFDEDLEINGAIDIINELSPPHKKAKLIQWSGNTSPYERFLRKVRESKIWNINGGESRYDPEYPSYSTIYPIGVQVGNERQIYSTASNENTYTNLWSERFFGYRYLIETVSRTNEPYRIAPFNVYFHSYSGERPASLQALKEIMEYAEAQDVIPLYTSEFAAIANGFYSVNFDQIGEMAWRVKNRGALQNVRFDGMEDYHVDYSHSKGVLGHRAQEGRLYVSLNPSVKEPEVFLREKNDRKDDIFIESSRFNVVSAKRGENSLTMKLTGFGTGDVDVRVPDDGRYLFALKSELSEKVTKASQFDAQAGQRISYEISDMNRYVPMILHIERR